MKDDGQIVKNYVSALRKFYRCHDDLPADDDEIGIEEDYNGRELSPDDVLYAPEIDDLLEAAQRENIRDMAAIAITLAVGLRVDAVRTLLSV